MPIKGLSERRRYSRGGKIRLGEKRKAQSGKEYPAKLDYFLFDPEDENLIQKFHAIYGETPKRLRVTLPSNNRDEVFPQDYKCYGRSGLLCKGDGDTAYRVPDGGGEMLCVECPGPQDCEYAMSRGMHGKPGCKPVASLQVILPDLPVLQTFQIDTSSINSIININSALDMMEKVAGRIGFIGVDLVLVERETMIQETGKKGTIYVMDLVIPIGLRQVTMLEAFGVAAGAPTSQFLASPTDESTPDALFPASQIYGDEPKTEHATAQAEVKPRGQAWAEWKRLKKEYNLGDHVLEDACDFLYVESFKHASEDRRWSVIDHIANGPNCNPHPEAISISATAPAPEPAIAAAPVAAPAAPAPTAIPVAAVQATEPAADDILF